MEHKAIYDLLSEKLGAGAQGFNEDEVESWADIAPGSIVEACAFLKADERLDFNQLMCLSSIDWDGLDENGKGKSVAILGYTQEGRAETSDRVAEGVIQAVSGLPGVLSVQVPVDDRSQPKAAPTGPHGQSPDPFADRKKRARKTAKANAGKRRRARKTKKSK